ncbi:hypothetical protein [Methylosinus sp. Sm6]|uniref:hypothetical protein n=1 Tax=Methylosinus sp. Sm6 TaxID=2866948 RepID=UPI001C99813F|nr:hypothetical protein [Methylosinus sp. Sm6]MBY6243926.1 hypothetical protein [Methylosinus sp. Sm6]
MVRVELERKNAEVILDILEHRLETIHQLEGTHDASLDEHLRREKDAIVPTIVALEACLKAAPRQ